MLIGRYQYPTCLREFARSDSLRMHLAKGICKTEEEDNETMEEPQDEEEEESDDDETEEKIP